MYTKAEKGSQMWVRHCPGTGHSLQTPVCLMELRGTHKSKAEKEGGGWWGKEALPCGRRVREGTAEKGSCKI